MIRVLPRRDGAHIVQDCWIAKGWASLLLYIFTSLLVGSRHTPQHCGKPVAGTYQCHRGLFAVLALYFFFFAADIHISVF